MENQEQKPKTTKPKKTDAVEYVEVELDMCPKLHKELADEAARNKVSIDRYITDAIYDKVSKCAEVVTAVARDKTQPVRFFDSLEELNEYACYWIHKLCLDDWYIKFKFVGTEEMRELAGETALGYCMAEFTRKAASIYLLKDIEVAEREAIKYCQEQILVHELLHCTVPGIQDSDKKVESCYWELMQHQRIETMSRALIMAKYNLTSGWFVPEKGDK